MKTNPATYTLCEVKASRRNRPRYAENLIEQGQAFKTMRQSLSLSRPATVKLLHVTLRTLHNWETGKVRIPYAAFKLIRLFNSYEIFHPIWKDWRIVGSRLITPEGYSLEAGNFHWLSLMARRADAFGRLSRQNRNQKESEMAEYSASGSGLVFNSTSAKLFAKNQQIQGFQNGLVPPLCNTGGKNPQLTPKNRLVAVLNSSFHQQKNTLGGAL